MTRLNLFADNIFVPLAWQTPLGGVASQTKCTNSRSSSKKLYESIVTVRIEQFECLVKGERCLCVMRSSGGVAPLYGKPNQTHHRDSSRREVNGQTARNRRGTRLYGRLLWLIPVQDDSQQSADDLFERHRSISDAEVQHPQVNIEGDFSSSHRFSESAIGVEAKLRSIIIANSIIFRSINYHSHRFRVMIPISEGRFGPSK